MKTTKIFAAAAGLAAMAAVAATGQSLLLQDEFRQAVQGTLLDEATKALSASPIPAGVPVAILPIAGDEDGWFAGQLKIALTAAGKNCVEGKEDPMWEEVQKEVTWDEHKEPFLDPETIDAFGKIQSAKILLSGAVRSLDYTERYAYFEIELHATEIVTKRHIWGAALARRHYSPGYEGVGGVEHLDPELRQKLLDDLREKLEASLRGTPAAASAGRVAMLPIAEDDNKGKNDKGYVGGLVRDALTRAGVNLVNADWTTLGEARMGLRDTQAPADAVLYGAVRDLSWERAEVNPTADKTTLRAEVQLCIEVRDANGGHRIPWSDTLVVSEKKIESKGVWGTLVRLFPSLERNPLLAVWWPLGILLALIVLKMFLNATTRVR
jgi:hypothetical protein